LSFEPDYPTPIISTGARAPSAASVPDAPSVPSAAELWDLVLGPGRPLRLVLLAPATRRIALAGLLVGCFVAVSGWVRQDVAKMKRFAVALDKLEVSPPPSYLSGHAERDVMRLPTPSEPLNAFDERLVPTVAYALESLPWVDRVESLRLTFPGRLSFRLALHEPTALIEVDGQNVAISKNRRFFPAKYVGKGERGRAPVLPKIIGLDPRGDDALSLDAVLALINSLRDDGLLLSAGIQGIDVSNIGGRVDPRAPEVRLNTNSGCIIDWGRLESSGRIHPKYEDRARRLEAFLASLPKRGSEPRLSKIRSLSLRWAKTTFVLAPLPVPVPAGEVTASTR